MNQIKAYTEDEIQLLTSKAHQFHDALFNDPIDENVIVDILSNTTNEERQIIRGCYKRLYNHPLQNDLRDELSYKLKDLCLNMFDTQYEYDARELHKALHSFMNDDEVIMEIFASRPKSHLEIVDKAYFNFYGISLKDDLQKEASKDYSPFLIAIMETVRPLEQTISGNDAYDTARDMAKNGLKVYGADINMFRNVFLEKSREDLILICRAYNEIYKKNLYDAIESEVGGKSRKLLEAILFATITPAEWFAKKTYKSIGGMGTDVSALYRIMISRAEIDMYAIRDYYFMDRKTDLKSDIEGDTSGAYGQVLINLSLK